MQFIDNLSALSYSFVKRNRVVRDLVMPIWKFTTNVRSVVRSLVTGAKPYAIPTGTVEINQLGSDVVVTILSRPAIVYRDLPGTIENTIQWKFLAKQNSTDPGTYVVELPEGRVFEEGAVITKENKLLSDVSKIIDAGEYVENIVHPVFTKKALPPVIKINGTVAVLSAPAGRGYYHWMFDVLPRVQLLKSAGYDLNTIDKFLINNYISRFHIETMKMLGIPRDKIIESGSNPHIQADRLIVPSLVGSTGSIPAYACMFLRNEFLPITSVKADNPKRIYLNRSKTVHRKVTNEKEIIAFLESIGFKNIAFEELSLQEQIALMASADVVVAPHGAGLTNIVFCKPGTKVIELLSPAAVNVMYWTLSNQIHLEYYYLLAEGVRPPDFINAYENNADMTFDVQKIKELMLRSAIE